MNKRCRLRTCNNGSRRASVGFLKVTTLALTGIFLLFGAGVAQVNATVTSGGSGGFVQDWVDEEAGLVGGHMDSHDILIEPAIDGPHSTGTEEAHWSWVATSPTDAPVVTTVTYFLHNGVGLHGAAPAMSPAQVADIAAAAGIWNTSGANVALVAVATDAAADVHVHMDTTSGCGGGAIGCAEFAYYGHNPGGYGAGSGHPVPGDPGPHPQHLMAGNMDGFGVLQELTMYSAVPWYSGPAGGIPVVSLDYLTVAIQEFGHHLGMGHNDVAHGHAAAEIALSPMNGLLPFGNDLRRTLQPTDIAAITHLYGIMVIPEPSSILLAVMACGGLIASGSRKRRAS